MRIENNECKCDGEMLGLGDLGLIALTVYETPEKFLGLCKKEVKGDVTTTIPDCKKFVSFTGKDKTGEFCMECYPGPHKLVNGLCVKDEDVTENPSVC